MGGVGATDASGNPILGDVGKWFYDKVRHKSDSEFEFASFSTRCVNPTKSHLIELAIALRLLDGKARSGHTIDCKVFVFLIT